MSASLRPSIRYAQNFLTDPALVDRLLDASSIGPADLVYEIGPGAGIITERLARRCRRVVAVERDPVLARRLQRRFADSPMVEIHEGDFLDVRLPAAPYKVFANIPFNRTAAIVTKLTRAAHAPDDQYLIVQRDAAERFTGRPRTTLYALLLGPWFETGISYRFRPTDFTPPPGVEAVLLRIAKRGPPLVCAGDGQLYRDFVVSLFTAWQPSIAAALDRLCPRRWVRHVLETAGIPPDATPSETPFSRWLPLFEAFRRDADAGARRHIAGAEARLSTQQSQLRKQHRTRHCATGPGPPARRCGATRATVAAQSRALSPAAAGPSAW